VAQLNDDTRHVVAGHARRPVAPGAVNPRCRPIQLAGGEPRSMDFHHDVVLAGLGVGHVRQGESTNAAIAISNRDCLHDSVLL
jgi:hypothetical protein